MLLAIETSCDETGVALISEEGNLIKHLVYSQVALHSPFGGIVPEIASRKQLEVLAPLTKKLLLECKVSLEALRGIAVTFGPGLIGSLLVGVTFAKTLALSLKLPLIKVDHLEAHISAIFIERKVEQEVNFPFVALLVSGGHTALFLVKSLDEVLLLGHTRDDAAGEAFDKVAKLLGLGYPGGPIISSLAEKGDPDAVPLPRPLFNDPSFDFSFSGLKTAVLNVLRSGQKFRVEDLCASFEKSVCEVLVKKTLEAAKNFGVSQVVVCGGVAANKKLRETFKKESSAKKIRVLFPSPEFCTDNAAMVGINGWFKWKKGFFADLEDEPYARATFKKAKV